MLFDTALASAHDDVPGCIGVVYVDIPTGMLLGVSTTVAAKAEQLDDAATALADLFDGRSLGAVARMLESEGDRAPGDFVMFLGDDRLHVLTRGRRYPDHAALFVCRSALDVRSVLSRVHDSLARIEAAF